MLHLVFIPIFLLMGCAGPGSNIFNLTPQKSYSEYLIEFNSCTGKGTLKSKGSLKGKLPFSFRSQRDSTFLEFSDPIGRKALLVWITNNSITARNLIDNKQYQYDEVTELLPVLKVLEPKDITQIIWGAQPNFKEKFKAMPQSLKNDIVLDFYKKNIPDEKQALVGMYYYEENAKNSIEIDIDVRKRNKDFLNMKKVWRLLKY
ncbi:MAG: hypothetical protein ACJZ2B_03050 [Candidatus Neomarinimicrobiota bacterium]|nr:hypothetical protein [Candidatus Neomarinimicrobiota bacterium]|tara:strand:- start:8470 stop:9078 length:609 start_codon:yes stop_codon:yes gene_type:complete